MVYGDNPVKLSARSVDPRDPLGLNMYSYKPDVFAIMQSGNLYVYCINNPIIWIDPTGDAIDLSELFKKGMEFAEKVLTEYPGFVKNTTSFITSFGERIPDFINDKVIGEIKNVAYQYNSSQIKGMMEIAKAQGKRFILVVNEATKVSVPLINAIKDAGGVLIRVAAGASTTVFAPFVVGLEDFVKYMESRGRGFSLEQ